MRYEKKVLVLSGVLVALLAIWALGLVFSPERVAARSESAHLLLGKPDEAASISLSVPGQAPIELAKAGAAWNLLDSGAKLPVRGERVSSFLSDLAAVSRLRLVARSKDSWGDFKLDEAQAKRAIVKDASGKVLADIYLGGYGPSGGDLYLRRASSNDSFVAETGLSSYLEAGRSGWLDLALFGGVKESEVQSLALKSNLALDGKGKPAIRVDYSLRRDGQGWKSGAAALNAEAAAALVRSVIGLQAEDLAAVPPPDAFAKLGASIRLDLGTGKSLALELGSEAGKDRFYARVPGSAAAAIVSAYSLKSCFRSQSELAKK